MELINLLLSDWAGRLSLFGILFSIGVVVYVLTYFTRVALKNSKEVSQEETDPFKGRNTPKLR